MATKKEITAENSVKNEKVENTTPIKEKTQEMANTEATRGSFVYIGPTLNTGIKENSIYTGTREQVEEHLKPTIEKYPQAKMLLVTTESLGTSKAKVKQTGTLLNKYYNDIANLSKKG
ncbi:MAG: hypothetical protein PHR62_02585 [Paludibacter sp.]|nr:hypothetical protein [Paludibacter sp.]